MGIKYVLVTVKRGILKIRLSLKVAWQVLNNPSFEGGVTFVGDGMLTTRPYGSFDKKFNSCFKQTFEPPVDPSIKRFTFTIWRSHLYTWAMNEALRLEGDMVELGVWWATFAYTGVKYLEADLKSSGKRFHLVDAWGFSQEENTKWKLPITSAKYQSDIFYLVKKKFDGLPVVFHRGYIPEILETDKESLPKKICFLSMDLNNHLAEKAGIEFLWDRIVTGGFICIDDFGHQGYEKTRSYYENFFFEKGALILRMPFGSALVSKPQVKS